ncbi:MAG: Calx-beta domain-containing protein, partial [Acidimicrobiia bacterium]
RFTTSDGTSLLSFPDNSSALAGALQGTTVRFTGAQATAANGGTAPRLFAPSTWQPGSSYSHLDDATYPAGNPNSLMTPSIGANEVIHSPGPVTLGIFADTGWNVSPTISVGGASVVEGKSGYRNLRFNVALSAPTNHTVTAHYATGNSTAVAPTDYTAVSGTVSIPAGSTTGSINVPVRGDNTVESTEKFAMVLSSPSGANLGRKSVSGSIIDDDFESGVQMSVGNAAIEEGTTGTRTLRVTVTLSATSTHATSASFATSDGTATAGVDYTATSGTVHIAAGSNRATISIPVSADTTTEANESIHITLSNPVGLVLRRFNGTGTINNDD